MYQVGHCLRFSAYVKYPHIFIFASPSVYLKMPPNNTCNQSFSGNSVFHLRVRKTQVSIFAHGERLFRQLTQVALGGTLVNVQKENTFDNMVNAL